MAKVTNAPPSRRPRREVMRGPYTMGPGSHEPADGLHDLRGRPAPLLVRGTVVALRRRPRVAEHRSRVHRPPCGIRTRRRPRGPRRRSRRDPELSRPVPVVLALRTLARLARPRARRPPGDHAAALARLLRGSL